MVVLTDDVAVVLLVVVVVVAVLVLVAVVVVGLLTVGEVVELPVGAVEMLGSAVIFQVKVDVPEI